MKFACDGCMMFFIGLDRCTCPVCDEELKWVSE